VLSTTRLSINRLLEKSIKENYVRSASFWNLSRQKAPLRKKLLPVKINQMQLQKRSVSFQEVDRKLELNLCKIHHLAQYAQTLMPKTKAILLRILKLKWQINKLTLTTSTNLKKALISIYKIRYKTHRLIVFKFKLQTMSQSSTLIGIWSKILNQKLHSRQRWLASGVNLARVLAWINSDPTSPSLQQLQMKHRCPMTLSEIFHMTYLPYSTRKITSRTTLHKRHLLTVASKSRCWITATHHISLKSTRSNPQTITLALYSLL
jgi:hypothetical protein